MKDQYSNIDDFFRKRFENFNPEPPAQIWEKIANKLHPSGGSGMFRTFIFSAISIISVGIIVLLITNPLSTDKNTVANPIINESDNISDQNKKLINKEKEIQELNVKPPEINNDIRKKGKDKLATSEPNQEHNKIRENYTAQKAEEKTITKNYANINSLAKNNSSEISKRPSDARALVLRSKINGISLSLSGNNDQYRSKSISNIFKIGAFINPEVVFYPSDSVSSSQNYNLGIDLRYHWSNFFIQSGLGVSIAKDEGRYDIGYNKYLGSYPDVYYVTIDSTEQGYVPVYHTKNVDVYDTIPHYSIRESTNTYTYLQIPLLFGYQIERPRLTYSFRAGPCLSVLMHENISDPDFPGDISVFSLSKQVSKRTETNWQLMIIAGLNYKAGRNIEVTLEPTFRYYLKSAYESKLIKTKHPYAVGIRAGFLFNF